MNSQARIFNTEHSTPIHFLFGSQPIEDHSDFSIARFIESHTPVNERSEDEIMISPSRDLEELNRFDTEEYRSATVSTTVLSKIQDLERENL